MVSLVTTSHAIYRLAPDLLLVFKPNRHDEAEHRHPYSQRLRVLRGRLAVHSARRRRVLRPGSAPLTIAAGRSHVTRALDDTWLLVESLPPRGR